MKNETKRIGPDTFCPVFFLMKYENKNIVPDSCYARFLECSSNTKYFYIIKVKVNKKKVCTDDIMLFL